MGPGTVAGHGAWHGAGHVAGLGAGHGAGNGAWACGRAWGLCEVFSFVHFVQKMQFSGRSKIAFQSCCHF